MLDKPNTSRVTVGGYDVGKVEIANDLPLVVIAGPCAIESRSHAMDMAHALKEITSQLGMGFVYKSSFDKANRTSLSGERGIGIKEGLRILADVRDEVGCPVITDVHDAWQCAPVAEVVDIIQIPAFLCRQTDLLVEAAQTGKPLNIKKGQFLAPWDMKNVVGKIASVGKSDCMLCERGASFGYNTLVNDMRALPILRSMAPVVFDATHSVQQPGGAGDKTAGQREYVPTLARAAVAIGVAAVFMETHQDPESAPSDGPNMVYLDRLPGLLSLLKEFDQIAKRNLEGLDQEAAA